MNSTNQIIAFYIYDKNGNNMFYREWNREKRDQYHFKNTYNIVSVLKTTCPMFSPPQKEGLFESFVTQQYKLHFYESPTRYSFIVLTGVKVATLSQQMSNFYREVFVPYVIRNPAYKFPKDFAEPLPVINSEKFGEAVDSSVFQWVNRK
mmetsp:Transcript_2576/g.3721  ORF Transcript_2576/g.3721 Transcript_2576/m.3721 type:complete len:149 (+) Transcript_2576:2-448(+)